MKIISIIALLATSLCTSLFAQKKYPLSSPDGKLKAEVVIGENISFSFNHDGTEALAPSTISMKLEGGETLGIRPVVRKVKTEAVNRVLETPFYKKSNVKDSYNETVFSFRGNYKLIFRVYDDGLAYRFATDRKDSLTVVSEDNHYAFGSDHRAVVPYVRDLDKLTFEQQFFNSFENLYTHESITRLDTKRLMFLPLLVELGNGKKLCITEADLEDYPGMFLNNTSDKPSFKSVFAPVVKRTENGTSQIFVKERENYIARTAGTRVFPWRTFIISLKDAELTNSDMVYRLASPSRVKDLSWIKPGKVAWEWWSRANLYGVDFRAGMNNDTYKYYIDFASRNGLEYIIMDGGWYNNKVNDLFKSVPDIDIKELVEYGKSKNVGILIWMSYSAMAKVMEPVIKHYAAMGVKGFKIDFFDRDDQAVIRYLYDCARVCAENKMVVDYHGICKPAGLQRTYPNVFSFEGVNGLEQMKWSAPTFDLVTYDVTIPFIRMVAGPMDYTPGAMRNSVKGGYAPIFADPMSQGTRCRQLAEYIVFESPLAMLSDSPVNYDKEPESRDFIATVPTVWKETVALAGKVGEYVSIARQAADGVWFVGGLTGWDARTLEVDLSFLGDGAYEAELFTDGINADRSACDYKRTLVGVSADKKLSVKMAPGGGFAMRIYKK